MPDPSLAVETTPGLTLPEIKADTLRPLLSSLIDRTERLVVAELVNHWATS